MNNGWDINWGEYVRYSDIQSCIDESGSTSVVAIDKNSIRGRVVSLFGFVHLWTVKQAFHTFLYILLLFPEVVCEAATHKEQKAKTERETMSSPSKRRDMDLMKLSVIFSELFLYFRFHKVFFCINLLSFFHLGCVGLTWIRSSSG